MSESPSPVAPSALTLALKWIDAEAPAAVSKQGGHDATFRTACTLVNGFDLGPGELESAMEHYNQRKCAPPWKPRELQHKIRHAQQQPPRYAQGWLQRRMLRERGLMGPATPRRTEEAGIAKEPTFEPKWNLPFDYDLLKSSVREDWKVTPEWFEERSPVPVRSIDAAGFLEHVFQKGDRVIVFTKYGSQGQFGHLVGRGSVRLAARDGIPHVPSKLPQGGPDGVWFLAQPVDGKWHPNPRETDDQGRPKMSRRSQESILEQRHILFECDHKAVACDCKDCKGRDNPRIDELWLNFLAQLPLPIVAIYSSGGKSWHALCRIQFSGKAELDAFKKRHGGMFSKYGADPRAWMPTQLTRLPTCMRGNRLQRLIYLNPKPDPGGVPIGEGGNVLCDE
jgi:hypothetical protein